MPGTYEPAQMFDHELNQKKGWPSPYAINFAAAIATGETGIYAGSVISLNDDGEFVLGLSSTGAMAIFALQSQTDLDVRSDLGNLAGGVASGLVAAGSLELQTTEFIADTYLPNDPLTVDGDGKLTKGTLYTDAIVGVVSLNEVAAAPFVSPSEHDAAIAFLSFWPVWLPPTP